MPVDDKFQRKYGHMSQLELIDEIKKLKKNKKYGIVWEENDDTKTKEKIDIQNKNIPILKEITKNNIHEKQSSTNILIEGDNYNALSILNYTHNRKIGVIYIDPPYNTGGDFLYNDNIVNKEDSYKHSKWLSFMYKRLRLARNLLLENGIIAVSIGDHELSNLIQLMNMIFGEENQIAIFLWKSRAKPTNTSTAKYRPQKNGEYVIVYGLNNKVKTKFNVSSIKQRSYPHIDNDGKFRTTTILTSNRGTYRRETMLFESGGYKPDKDYRWKSGKVIIDNLFATNRILLTDEGLPMEKKYEHEESDPLYPIYTFMDTGITGTAENGKKDLDEIVGNKHGLDTVKPVQLLKYLCATFSSNDDIILDFFAGSGTTGQAVMELNKEDGGNRKFILCTNNENNICTDVCYPRLKKVMKGYDFKGKEKQVLFEEKITAIKLKGWRDIQSNIDQIRSDKENEFDEIKVEIKNNTFKLIGINNIDNKKKGLGGNLSHFKTEFFEWRSTLKHKYEFTKTATELLCIKEDCFKKVKIGPTKFKIFKNHNDKYLAIIYDHKDISDFEKTVKEIKGDIHTYVFSVRDVVDISYFKKSNKKIKLKPIPLGIVDIYEKIIRNLKFS